MRLSAAFLDRLQFTLQGRKVVVRHHGEWIDSLIHRLTVCGGGACCLSSSHSKSCSLCGLDILLLIMWHYCHGKSSWHKGTFLSSELASGPVKKWSGSGRDLSDTVLRRNKTGHKDFMKSNRWTDSSAGDGLLEWDILAVQVVAITSCKGLLLYIIHWYHTHFWCPMNLTALQGNGRGFISSELFRKLEMFHSFSLSETGKKKKKKCSKAL